MSSISGSGSGGGGGVGNVKFLQGNTGGPVGPDGAGILYTPGGNNITAAGNAGTNTVTFSLTGTTDHSVQVGNASGSLTSVANGTTGQTLHAVTGADPVWSSVSLINDVSGVLPLANGGTNNSGALNVFGVSYFDGTRIVNTTVGTAGQVLTSNGVGVAPTFQANSGIAVINGDVGSASGSPLTFTAQGAAKVGATWSFTGSGSTQTLRSLDASSNMFIGTGSATLLTDNVQQTIAIGANALQSLNSPSIANVFVGYNCGQNAQNSQYNTAVGWGALMGFVSSGLGVDQNVAMGQSAFYQLSSGTLNVGLGAGVGTNYTGAESQNIIIGGAYGTLGESNKTRIGYFANAASQTGCFIDGIDGITVTGAAVLVATGGQLGVAVSSEKYKDNIQDMGDASSRALNLRPVTFSYKGGSDTRFGLIAEEVHKVLPEIVVYDNAGAAQTVMYQELPAILLNELQKALKRIEVLESKLGV